jgi:hypothetical protein
MIFEIIAIIQLILLLTWTWLGKATPKSHNALHDTFRTCDAFEETDSTTTLVFARGLSLFSNRLHRPA